MSGFVLFPMLGDQILIVGGAAGVRRPRELRFHLFDFFLHEDMESFFRVVVQDDLLEKVFQIFVVAVFCVSLNALVHPLMDLLLLFKPLLHYIFSERGLESGCAVLLLVLKEFDHQLHLLLVLPVDGVLYFFRHLPHTVEAVHLGNSHGLDVRVFDILL